MDKKTIKLVERKDLSPKCPHCQKELDEICWTRRKGPSLNFWEFKLWPPSPVICFFCPACFKLIGTQIQGQGGGDAPTIM